MSAATFKYHQSLKAIEIIALATDLAARGQGLASALMHRLKNKATAQKAFAIVVNVSVSAIEWYQKREFKITDPEDPRLTSAALCLRPATGTVTMHWRTPTYTFPANDAHKRIYTVREAEKIAVQLRLAAKPHVLTVSAKDMQEWEC